MKTAIIGLPMVGKTSLFTILTGVHESTRVGSMEARVGMTKVPDARLDALAKVLRTFDSDTVPHDKGSVDPIRDFEDVEVELILSDLVVVEKRMERLDKDRKKTKAPDLDKEFALLERIKTELDANRALREMEFSDEDEKRIRGFQFL